MPTVERAERGRERESEARTDFQDGDTSPRGRGSAAGSAAEGELCTRVGRSERSTRTGEGGWEGVGEMRIDHQSAAAASAPGREEGEEGDTLGVRRGPIGGTRLRTFADERVGAGGRGERGGGSGRAGPLKPHKIGEKGGAGGGATGLLSDAPAAGGGGEKRQQREHTHQREEQEAMLLAVELNQR
jgi:hypothetical protein